MHFSSFDCGESIYLDNCFEAVLVDGKRNNSLPSGLLLHIGNV